MNIKRYGLAAGLAAAMALVIFASAHSVTSQQNEVSLVLTGGRIWTGDAKQPWAEAVAIRGDRVAALGSAAEIAKLRGDATRVIDLRGRFVMPGINDAHIHFLSGAMRLSELDLNDATSLKEIQQRLADFAAKNPKSEWLLGFGWTYTAIPGSLPTREQLDAIIKDRPVWLSAYDGHTGWANSKALELAGVTAATQYDGFGEIVHDAAGNPTGVFKEGAQSLVRRKIPQRTRGQRVAATRQMLAWAAQLGITSIQNAHGNEEDLSIFEELLKGGELTTHTSVAMSVEPRITAERIAEIAALAKKYSGPMLRVNGIKIMADGVIESHTAAMLEPYSDNPKTRGEPAWSQEDLNRVVALADKAGLQVYIHAIGDRGVRMALNAYQHAREMNGPRDSRHRIEHIETVSPTDIPRFAALGVMASMMPIHGDPGAGQAWSRAVGPEREKHAFAWRSLEQAGATLVFSSDWTAAISIDPMRGLHTAVNRTTKEGTPPGGWIPEQRISVESTLRAYTRAGAFSSFEEKEKGTLMPGMRADLIVLSADPFRTPPAKLHTLKVEATVFDGRMIFEKK